MYADYVFYTDTFYGTAINAADFPRLASRASDFIDYYTRGKAAAMSDESTLNSLAKCCCAIAEQIQIDSQSKALIAKKTADAISSGNGEIKSETVGSWSQSYVTSNEYSQNSADIETNNRQIYANIAIEYLLNTGLLYRGGCTNDTSSYCNRV